jgi:hypothetical protein
MGLFASQTEHFTVSGFSDGTRDHSREWQRRLQESKTGNLWTILWM